MTTTTRSLSRTLLVLAAAATLGGCAAVVVGGAAATARVAADRRSAGTQIEDQAIELKAVARVRDTVGDRGHVNVVSYNRQLLITGEAANDADRSALEQALSRIENVRATVNELAVMPSSSLQTRSNDTILTSKVKASFVDAKDMHANAVKVVTERSVVYLMGRVTEREANRATDIARGVGGVQKVVKVFDLMSEAELAALGSDGKK